MRQYGLDLRPEQQPASIEVVIERLDSQPVARDEQPPLAPIPDREGEHAAQVLHAIAAIFLIQMNNAFCIAFGAVAMSARLKTGAEVLVVIDFAVVNDP